MSIYALVTGLFCIAVGILGYFTGRFKSAMFACPFMFFSLLIGIMMMIVAALSGGNKSATIALMSSLCNTNLQFIKSTDNITKFYSANMTI